MREESSGVTRDSGRNMCGGEGRRGEGFEREIRGLAICMYVELL